MLERRPVRHSFEWLFAVNGWWRANRRAAQVNKEIDTMQNGSGKPLSCKDKSEIGEMVARKKKTKEKPQNRGGVIHATDQTTRGSKQVAGGSPTPRTTYAQPEATLKDCSLAEGTG
jgi:hypothetical protein